MIVCVCNRLNDTKVREAIARGATCPDSVYAHHGCKKVCGTCQDKIVALVRDEAMADERAEEREAA
jgi:bacterioferritin-associated ferredoxin